MEKGERLSIPAISLSTRFYWVLHRFVEGAGDFCDQFGAGGVVLQALHLDDEHEGVRAVDDDGVMEENRTSCRRSRRCRKRGGWRGVERRAGQKADHLLARIGTYDPVGGEFPEKDEYGARGSVIFLAVGKCRSDFHTLSA